MNVQKHSMTWVNTASTHTQISTGYLHGIILAVQYIASTSVAISSTADLTITTADSSHKILDSLAIGASWQKSPANTVVNTTNGAITNESSPIPVADERFNVKISKTTSTGQSGIFHIWTG